MSTQPAAPSSAPAPLPDFVARRIERFYTERFQRDWGGQHILHGTVPGTNALHLSSNDYLCLSNERSLLDAQAQSIKRAGYQLLMSLSLHHGNCPIARLEHKLAQFLNTESTIVCQSGWGANTGLMQTISGPSIPVYLDRQAHPSFWYGATAANADIKVFRHNSVDHACELITQHGPGVLVIDAIYSINGSAAPLNAFCDLAQQTDCVLVVDESHSVGVCGPHGSGLISELGLGPRVHFITVSLAKAFAGRAGVIACPTAFKDYFHMNSYPTSFSSTLLEHELTWFEYAADFLSMADDRRTRLESITRHTREKLSDLGYDVSTGTEQIIALTPGTEKETIQLRDALEHRGIFGSVFCWPATPKDGALVRLTLNSGLSDEHIEQLIAACTTIRAEVRPERWPHRPHEEQLTHKAVYPSR
ncbi:alpha-hydroxyketone-type quorum-sensing autoinducer synthase [Pseudomonas fontis]|uniref:Quorum-sensing autoinducer CAI-1 synthase n=1 Tax=Pseudomonas fontis TaxID=2942633 RepID=A0ABT5NVS1_9PSED|nr:alpha-hydroxyketone-type quorum-sensing autoinducer synthase [Pseudomonas fontis]MDD0975307.1 quorum-sensing autoinducer CAI-1 synthase [Pseudomonas fontis]MDD0992277.1 quorum-sensing autoinducer CAI-1 synthase [Pseudomonas fontis]